MSSIHYLLCFSHVRQCKKDNFWDHCWAPNLVRQGAPARTPSKIHPWQLRCHPGGPSLDFWAPQQIPFGGKSLSKSSLGPIIQEAPTQGGPKMVPKVVPGLQRWLQPASDSTSTVHFLQLFASRLCCELLSLSFRHLLYLTP